MRIVVDFVKVPRDIFVYVHIIIQDRRRRTINYAASALLSGTVIIIITTYLKREQQNHTRIGIIARNRFTLIYYSRSSFSK